MNLSTIKEIEAKRIAYLDLLKIIAAFLVIFTHTGDLGSKYYIYRECDFLQKYFYMACDVMRTVNIPLFFMISGALMLNKEISYKECFRKYISKYLCIIVVWSYFYFVINNGADSWNDFGNFFLKTLDGDVSGHFWYLYTYLGYLFLLPIMKKIINVMNNQDFHYLLLIGIFFKGALNAFMSLFGSGMDITVSFLADSIFYPMIGYYFAHRLTRLTKKEYSLLFITAVLSVILTILCIIREYGVLGQYTENYLFSFSVIPSICIFYFCKSINAFLSKNDIIRLFINHLGSCSLGVYVFGYFLQVKFSYVYGIFYQWFGDFPLIVTVCYVGTVVIIAVVLTTILKCIPLIKRLL